MGASHSAFFINRKRGRFARGEGTVKHYPGLVLLVPVLASGQSTGGLPALKEELAAEAARAMAQEQAISSAVTQASGSIDAEVARAKAAEAALDAKIQSEARQRVEADTVLGSSISTEAAARQQGDADTLSAAKAYAGAGLSTEGAARFAADAAQQAALSTEAAARAGGDASTLAAAKAYADGLKVRVAVEPAGANCPTGGAMIADGANVAYACNGQSGESFAMCTYIWGESRPAGTACGSGASDGRTRVCDGAGTCSLCVPNAGASPRFVTNFGVEFGTVTDRSTCLVWEKKTGNVGIDTFCTSSSLCPNPHDVNNRYTWSTGSQYWNFDGTAATVFLTQLNDGGFAGHTDWRLPSSGGNWESGPTGLFPELESILDFCTSGTCIDPVFGPTANAHPYWSSTPRDTVQAWFTWFSDAGANFGSKQTAYHVRAVRGGP